MQENNWIDFSMAYPTHCPIDITLEDGSILCNCLPQSDGDIWWSGAGTGEKFIDPLYATIEKYRISKEEN